MREGFSANGEVRLLDARSDGNLECVDGRFKNPYCNAFNADGAEIRGGAYLQDGFRATGEVRFLGHALPVNLTAPVDYLMVRAVRHLMPTARRSVAVLSSSNALGTTTAFTLRGKCAYWVLESVLR